MIPLTLAQVTWVTTLVATAALAFWRGGVPERAAASVLCLAYLISLLVTPPAIWVGPHWPDITVNGVEALAMTGIAFKARRWWPIYTSAFAWLSFGMFLTVFFEPAVRARAYYSLSVVWDYGQLSALLYGLVFELPKLTKNPADVIIGRNLRRARAQARLTTVKLAAQIGISPLDLAQTEAGQRILLPIEMCFALRALNMTVAELFDGFDAVGP